MLKKESSMNHENLLKKKFVLNDKRCHNSVPVSLTSSMSLCKVYTQVLCIAKLIDSKHIEDKIRVEQVLSMK